MSFPKPLLWVRYSKIWDKLQRIMGAEYQLFVFEEGSAFKLMVAPQMGNCGVSWWVAGGGWCGGWWGNSILKYKNDIYCSKLASYTAVFV